MKIINSRTQLWWLIIQLIFLTASLTQAATPTTLSWGLIKTQTPQAWQMTEGSSDIIVAVIDTGVDTEHPDLKNSLWKNPGELGVDLNGKNKSNNSIDDDANGYIDDVFGWNFASEKADVTDDHGHGTHISGLIAGNSSRENGIRGVAPHVKLMTLKYYDTSAGPNANLNAIVKCIKYAIQMKARIINFSGGGLYPSSAERAAIEVAQQNGILFVAAAGNEKSNSDLHHYYPADYALNNIISVTAIDPQGRVLPSSNFGAKSVDVAAPGENLLSTLPNGQWGVMSGTSQATALVSGVAALLLSQHPDWKDPEKMIRHIVKSGDRLANLNGKTRYGSKLNSFQALSMSDDDF